MRSALLAFGATAVLFSSVAIAHTPGLSVAEVLAKSDALQKKGMLAIFSSDLGLIKAEARRDIPPQQRGMSSVQGFADFMRAKYPCR